MKLYDFDGMFDKKISAFISKNAGRLSEEQLEDLIPREYEKFGDAPLKSIGMSPRAYYAAMSAEELVKCLRAHVKNGVPVPGFLCREAERRPECTELLLPLLDGGEEGLKPYIVTILGDKERAVPLYMELVLREQDGDFKDGLIDMIKQNADLVKERALECYSRGEQRQLMLEILSCVKKRDERVFNVLIKEFRGGDDVQMLAGYLAAYGDERALGFLYEKIEEEGLPFIEFQEIKYAIEALGGEYTGGRDYSGDPAYELVHSHGAPSADIFSAFEENAEGGKKQ